MDNNLKKTVGRGEAMIGRRAALPAHLRMECIYLLRGHGQRRKAVEAHLDLREGELRKYRAVENALSETEPALRGLLMVALTTRTAYEHLDVPCGRQTFYRRRRELIAAIAREMDYTA